MMVVCSSSNMAVDVVDVSGVIGCVELMVTTQCCCESV